MARRQQLIYFGPYGFAVTTLARSPVRRWSIHPPLLPRAMRGAPSSPPLTRAERTP